MTTLRNLSNIQTYQLSHVIVHGNMGNVEEMDANSKKMGGVRVLPMHDSPKS